MSNHPDTCLLDDHDGWIVCSCHGNRWRELAAGTAPCACFYGNCDGNPLDSDDERTYGPVTMVDEECIHGLTGRSCTICIHGPAPRSARPSTSNCRSCEAEIIWVETEKGRTMPIDAEPAAGGRFALSADGKSVAFVHAHLSHTDLHSSHFETCPDSAAWKRSR